MPKRGKKYREAAQKIDRAKRYTIEEACQIIPGTRIAKFDESVDVAVRLGVNPKYADQMVRGAVVMPHGTGKTIRVAVFAKGDKAKAAEAAGAEGWGAEDLGEKGQGGFLDFDATVATPDMMGLVGKLGRILGTRGLMPNPKVGTVTFDVGKAVKELKAGRVEFRVEKAGIVHAPVGRVSFGAEPEVSRRAKGKSVAWRAARGARGPEGTAPQMPRIARRACAARRRLRSHESCAPHSAA